MRNTSACSAVVSSAPSGRPKTVLLLVCAEPTRADAERQLATVPFGVAWAESGAAAVAELHRSEMPVLVDFSRGAAALHAIRELRTQRHADTLVFALVDPRRADLAVEAVLAGAADVLPTPLDGARFAAALDRELGIVQSDDQPAAVVNELYCYSSAMSDLKAHVETAAAGRGGVLLRGERGKGREAVARAIHAAAAAARPGAFVVVDCAVSDADRLGVELFGAPARVDDSLPARELERIGRDGAVYRASKGTLYLRNLADAPTRVQLRLARLLRDREALLTDARELVAVDVRCMAAVDHRLEAALEEGTLHADLYRRLTTTRIDVPALRGRREDIAMLANRFQRAICAELGVAPKLFSRSALALLRALPWGGNALELKPLLRTIISGLPGRGVGVEDVLAHVRIATGSVMVSNCGTLRQARVQFEQQYITTVLQQHRGRITQAAKALGIQRTNLYRKMRTLNVAQSRH